MCTLTSRLFLQLIIIPKGLFLDGKSGLNRDVSKRSMTSSREKVTCNVQCLCNGCES